MKNYFIFLIFIFAGISVLSAASSENCNENEIRAVQPLKAIVKFVESQAAVPQLSEAALKVAESLNKNGISCDLRPEQTVLRGIQCKGRLADYPEPVRFYIPANYVKSEKNMLNIFFHGFEVAGNIYQVNPNDRKGYGDFGGRLAESGNNQSILVVPESRSTLENKKVTELTYSKYFQDGSGENFEKFQKLIQLATDSQFSSTGLAGHSGGYLPLNALLGYPKVAKAIRSAALFDGSYYATTKITDWLNSNPENRLRLSWVKNGSVTRETKAFISRVQRSGQMIQVPTTGTHMENIEQGGLADFLAQN